LKASVQLERSSVARCSGVVFRTHSSYAKFGPPLMVARYLEIACSHRSGFCRKATGDISTLNLPP
jgi:hypothetical protein